MSRLVLVCTHKAVSLLCRAFVHVSRVTDLFRRERCAPWKLFRRWLSLPRGQPRLATFFVCRGSHTVDKCRNRFLVKLVTLNINGQKGEYVAMETLTINAD